MFIPAADLKNSPLSFELKLDLGLTEAAIEHFGLGFAGRGVMKGRIAIPIHDEYGQLIAYAGRWAANPVPDEESRYKLPDGFHKSQVLYNLHRVILSLGHPSIASQLSNLFRIDVKAT